MPELPEVETVVRALRKPLVGRTFTEVRCYWPKQIDRPPLPEFSRRLHGQRVTAVTRRGKYILIELADGDTLIIHLRMSGHLAVVPREQEADKHTHTIFGLDDGRELRFRNQRKFGRVYLVADFNEVVGKLGPEPLEDGFTVEVLAGRLHGRKTRLKPLLLDQTFVAGIGNIYADEALFHARLHPERKANTLEAADITRLHTAIRKVLKLGIAREGASIDLYTKPDGSKGDMQNAVAVFRRTGDPCYTCGEPVQRIVLGGRSTHFCPHCQHEYPTVEVTDG